MDGGWLATGNSRDFQPHPVDVENMNHCFKIGFCIYMPKVVGLRISEPSTVVIPRHEFRGFLGGGCPDK